jgi:carboxypeptidase Q
MHLLRTATVLITALTLTACALADQPKPKGVEELFTAALASQESYAVLSHLTDNIGPRLSGSAGAEEAVRWTTQKFKEWGIDVHNEAILVPHWVRGAEQARLVSHLNQNIIVTTLGGSVATPSEGITAEVIVVRNFDELKALGEKARGKIVVFNAPMDLEKVKARRAFEAYGEAVVYRGVGAVRAAEVGAVAALVRSVGSASLRTPHTGALRYDDKVTKIPAGAITAEDAELLQRLSAKGEKIVMKLVLTPQMLPDVPSANVIAEIRGSKHPDEIVLIGAHLDSWDLGTGAIDNGAGVAMVMETMRLLKSLDIRPKKTIRAVLFMNEENGLRGGRGYAERHKLEIERHAAAIESDAGAAAPLGFITTLAESEMVELKKKLQILERIGATQMVHSPSTGADTSPLTAAGVPGFGVFPDPVKYFDYHHTSADTLDKVDPKELAADTAAMSVLALTIANMEEQLPRNIPDANEQ